MCGRTLITLREVVQEFGESLAALQVVEKGLEWNARAAKDRCTAKDLGVPRYDFVYRVHGSSPLNNSTPYRPCNK